MASYSPHSQNNGGPCFFTVTQGDIKQAQNQTLWGGKNPLTLTISHSHLTLLDLLLCSQTQSTAVIAEIQ